MKERLLAIDPAATVTGWAFLRSGELVDAGTFKIPHGNVPDFDRIAAFGREIEGRINCWAPTFIASEAPWAGPSPRTTILLATLRGVIISAAYRHRVAWVEASPAKWRKDLGLKREGEESWKDAALRECRDAEIIEHDAAEAYLLGKWALSLRTVPE